MNKPGRNDNCPCGSGRKYKKCCLPQKEASAASGRVSSREPAFLAELRPELDAQVDRVLSELEAGAGESAEPALRKLIQANPNYHMTNYAMGVYLAMVRKDLASAIPFFETAVRILPYFPEAHFNLGMAARQRADIPKSVAAFRAAVKYSRIDDQIAEMARRELASLQEALSKTTRFSDLDAYLANARIFDQAFEHLSKGQYEQAILQFNRVLEDLPEHVQSYGNLGLCYAGLGQRTTALEHIDKALALDPGYEPARLNRPMIEEMTEGQPAKIGGIREVRYYMDKMDSESP